MEWLMKLSPELFERVTGLDVPTGGEEAGRRADVRMQHRRRGVLMRERSKSDVPAVAMVRDISIGGIGLYCIEEMKVGETFVVKLPREASEGISIKCEVTRCSRGGMGGAMFDVGATFSEVIEASE
jgi:hypothetical protein